MIARSIVIPFLFALLCVQSHSILEIESIIKKYSSFIEKNEFTAEFITTEPYYASLMPILIQIQFSSSVVDLDETHFLVFSCLEGYFLDNKWICNQCQTGIGLPLCNAAHCKHCRRSNSDGFEVYSVH